jgi:hypothetical protein
MLLVFAQAAGTLLVLGALSGTARADVANSQGVGAPDQPIASLDVRVGSSGLVVRADARIDGMRTTADVSVAAFLASVAADEADVSLSLERTHVPEQVHGPPHDNPSGRPATAAGGRRDHLPSIDGDDRWTAPTRTDWPVSVAARQQEGTATSWTQHPLQRQLHALAASSSVAATSSADARPDLLGLLADRSLPLDSASKPFRSVINVSTFELVRSTGPPG